MRRNYPYIALFLIAICTGVALVSCEKVLDVKTSDVLYDEDAFKDNFSARSAVLGVYALMQNVAEQYVILGELQGDLVTVTDNADNDLIQINEHNAGTGNKYTDPTNFFKIIVNCNEVISKINRVKKYDNTITTADINGYLTELIVIRAWAYFTMVKIYGQVPYFEEPVDNYSTSLSLEDKLDSLRTPDFIIDTLLTQLTKVDTFNLNIDESSPYYAIRAKRWTIWALQGEMNLWKNNYTEARNAYYKVINVINTLGFSGTTRLPWVNINDYNNTDWEDLFQFDFSDSKFESNAIFIIPFSKTYNQQNDLQKIFGYGTGGEYLLKPTDYILNLYQAQKIVSWEDQPDDVPGTPGDLNRGKGVSYDSIDGFPVVTKYSLFRESYDYDAGVFLYGAGDFHLNYCESICRLGQLTNAIEHLNQGKLYNSPWGSGIRSRVNLKNVTPVNAKDKNEVENIILDERAMELAFEGHRWFDLVQFARHKNDPSFLADKVAAKFSDVTKREEVRNRLMNEDNWYLPLVLK